MHALAVQLAPVMAAEKSKTPFYIVGGLLVVWALVLSLGIGLNRPDFPSTLRGQRGVIAISAVLVLATVAAAVATASPPAKEASASSAVKPVGGPESLTDGAPQPEATTTATTPASSETSSASTEPASTSTSASTTPSTPASTTTSATPSTTTTTAKAPSAPVAKSSSLSLAANPSGLLSYNTKTLSAKAGTVTINFANSSPLEHNVTIAEGSKVLGATPTFTGGSKTLSLKLKPGKYTFYCSVPGHRQAGMEGTLNVS
jgi:plastocyanin